MMDVNHLGKDQGSLSEPNDKHRIQGAHSMRFPFVEQSIGHSFYTRSEDLTFNKYIISFRPDCFDERIKRQNSCFTLHGYNARTLTFKENHTLRSMLIPADAKISIQRSLFILGVDEFAIRGDMDALACKLKYAYSQELKQKVD